MRELYQQLILDHGRHPRNVGDLPEATHNQVGFNPLCGDKLRVFIREESGVIKAVKFKGEGCAISMASASMMTEALTGKTVAAAKALFEGFHHAVTGEPTDVELGKLNVLAGVSEFPARVKCASLPWHTFIAALDQHGEVTIE